MYHKMEAALSAAVTAAEAADAAHSQHGHGSESAAGMHVPTNTFLRQPCHSAASMTAAHHAATATRGGRAAAAPAFSDVDVSVHGSTAAAARESVHGRAHYDASMRLPRRTSWVASPAQAASSASASQQVPAGEGMIARGPSTSPPAAQLLHAGV